MSSQAHDEDAFHSFASALVRHLRALPGLTLLCPQCDTNYTTGIVELALLVGRQLQAFKAGDPSSTGPEAPAPPSRDVMRGENSNGRATGPVFQVKRKSKKGEAVDLTMSSLTPLFGLHLPNAAKELGISRTSLKKACRSFGLHRWPGRKVRGLESTIHGLERALVGQGDDSKAAGMRSEIPKLQHELDELCHGTPAQITEKMHSSAAITTNAYRRLYYARGWRSKHHNRGRHGINTGNPRDLTSGLALPPAHESISGASRPAKAKKQPKRKLKRDPCIDDPPANKPSETTPNADKESPRPTPRKYIRPRPRRILRSRTRLGCRETELKASDLEGLLPEVHDHIFDVAGREEVPESVVQAQNGDIMWTPTTQIVEEGTGDGIVALDDEGDFAGERSGKRPKTE